MNLNIKLVDLNDFDSLKDFFLENDKPSITRYFNPFPLTEESAYGITKNKHKDFYYVAYLDNKIVGFTMLRGWEEGYIVPSFGILVHHKFTNLGYGKILTNFTLDQALNLNCKKVRLTVYKSNFVAIHIYRSLGFSEISHEHLNLDGVQEIKIIMEKELNSE
jgi:ribosomal protein S18 acetylase RimI-like enzyme